MNTTEKIGQSTISRPAEREKSGPPQFLIDATVAVNAGQPEKAIDILKQAVPQDGFTACNAIGQIYLSLDENEKALEWLRRAREDRPDSIMLIAGIGRALAGLGRRDEAVEELTKAMKVQSNIQDVHLLADVMLQIQASDQAVELLRQIVEKNPSRMDVVFEFARVLEKSGQLDEAEQWYKKILQRKPNALVYQSLGNVCDKKNKLSESVKYRRSALEADPHNVVLLNELAIGLMRAGETQESISLWRKAIEIEPANNVIHSNLLFNLHNLPDITPQLLFDEHKKWAAVHSPISLAGVSHDNDPNPDRRLRVGYISNDFRSHSVTYFFEPLLNSHNPEDVEVYGYGNVKSMDEATERLKSRFNCYRNVLGLTDETVADMIQDDKIDILVDLAGHTSDNRLVVLGYKPAPVQVSYLGYPDTTGMEQIDYRFTDDLADLPESQKFYTEELVFLPDGFLCYRPPDFAPSVTSLPAERKGYITFGSFNNNMKINPFIIGIWAEILKNNSNWRFIMKFPAGNDHDVREHYLRDFERFGIARERVDIYGFKSPVEHLQLYSEMDIALDTYPYNGTTTTCEALWMGVPVISLAGELHASRVSLSILTRLGLESMATSTPEEYVVKAAALAGKVKELAEIRASIRELMAAGKVCNAKLFAHHVETTYRKMWYRWCQSGAKPD